jgi:MFS family permease
MQLYKLWYFLYFSGNSCLKPFLNVIFRRYGISEDAIGTLAMLQPFISLPSGLFVSTIADKYRVHDKVLVGFVLASSVTRLALYYVRQFWVIVVIVLVAGACSAPCTILLDSACSAATEALGDTYARQRMYGAIGWGTFSLVSGYCIDAFGIGAAFILYGVLSLGTLVPSNRIDWAPLEEKLYKEKGRTQSEPGIGASQRHIGNKEFLEKMRSLMNADAVLFFIMTSIMGTAVGTIEGFLFLFLEDLGSNSLLMGLTLTVTCISETGVFYWSGSIIDKLGINKCLHLCFSAFVVRLLLYTSMSWWSSVWLVLPVELLHGITFGLTWSVGSKKSALIAPPGLESTTQSVFQGLMFGLGYGLGGLVGGNVYKRLGPTATFATELSIVCLGWLACGIAQIFVSDRMHHVSGSHVLDKYASHSDTAPHHYYHPVESIEVDTGISMSFMQGEAGREK